MIDNDEKEIPKDYKSIIMIRPFKMIQLYTAKIHSSFPQNHSFAKRLDLKVY